MAGCIFFSGTRQDDPVNKPNLKLFLVSLKLNKKESRCQVGYPPPPKKKRSAREGGEKERMVRACSKFIMDIYGKLMRPIAIYIVHICKEKHLFKKRQ